jgi:hypothetical protein
MNGGLASFSASAALFLGLKGALAISCCESKLSDKGIADEDDRRVPKMQLD